jgi:hypothetical protein
MKDETFDLSVQGRKLNAKSPDSTLPARSPGYTHRPATEVAAVETGETLSFRRLTVNPVREEPLDCSPTITNISPLHTSKNEILDLISNQKQVIKHVKHKCSKRLNPDLQVNQEKKNASK